MAFPRRSSRTPRSRFTIGLLLLTALTVLVLDLPGTGPLDPVRDVLATAFRPLRAAGNTIFEPISNGWKGAFGYDDVRDENDQLRAQLEEKKGREAELERLQRENEELNRALGITVPDTATKAVRVVAGPISSFEQVVQVDIGGSDDVKPRMAVITDGGVFGRVADTGAGRATVDLITKPGVKIGIATEAGETGLVEGQGPNQPLVLTIDDAVHLREGDPIFTSGIDRSAFPGEVPVGTVSSITEIDGGPARRIEVEPSADLASRLVKIVLRDPPR